MLIFLNLMYSRDVSFSEQKNRTKQIFKKLLIVQNFVNFYLVVSFEQ